jgi:hypothetical protein
MYCESVEYLKSKLESLSIKTMELYENCPDEEDITPNDIECIMEELRDELTQLKDLEFYMGSFYRKLESME